MSKQSLKDPKFRCNICKEYYHAPEKSVHYQCAVHGYMCEKHVGYKGQRFYAYNERKNTNAIVNYRLKKAINVFEILETEWIKGDPDSNPVFDTVVELPESLVDHCLCHPEQKVMTPFYTYYGTKDWDFNQRCKKKLIKYNWNENAQRWMEEGVDNNVNLLTNQNNFDLDLSLLIDLFEKSLLSKEQFLLELKKILKL